MCPNPLTATKAQQSTLCRLRQQSGMSCRYTKLLWHISLCFAKGRIACSTPALRRPPAPQTDALAAVQRRRPARESRIWLANLHADVRGALHRAFLQTIQPPAVGAHKPILEAAHAQWELPNVLRRNKRSTFQLGEKIFELESILRFAFIFA